MTTSNTPLLSLKDLPTGVLLRGLVPTSTGTTPAGLPGYDPGSAENPSFLDQVTIEELHSDELVVTEHPIAIGAPITDHAYKRPVELTVHIGWSQGGSSIAGPRSATALNSIYASIVLGQTNRVLYQVITGKRIYTNMLIKSIKVQTDMKTENVLMMTLDMKQVLLVAPSNVTAVPASIANQTFAQSTADTQQNGTVSAQDGVQTYVPFTTTPQGD